MTNQRPRIALFAYSQPGFACLEELIKLKANISIVFTHIDAPDEEIWFDSVYSLAQKNNITVYRSNKIDAAALELFKQASPDIILSAYYRAIIPDSFLTTPRLGAYNLHGSLLPKYRGRACINWAVLKGEKQTGVTMHVMTNRADKGDIIAQEAFPIKFTDTGHDIFLKTSQTVKNIIKNYLPLIESSTAPHFPQDESQATKFGRRRPADGIINWDSDVIDIYNLIRSVTHPFPGAFTFYKGKKIFIWWAVPLDEKEFIPLPGVQGAKNKLEYKSGDIINTNNKIIIKCQHGYLLLKTVAHPHDIDCLPTSKAFSAIFKTGNQLG
ncbi:formyltransferase family protein [Pectinatus sottacetonis]|uniref:formyltransferase family protein n=1 Tax=Pectinatus sottacetonis TaxID=1002795 RepID=UPI0018C7E513|nr:formyltransferase family protein [Pectinatus sottacetonis]